MKKYDSAVVRSLEPMAYAGVSLLDLSDFQQALGTAFGNGLLLSALFAAKSHGGEHELVAVLSNAQARRLYLLKTRTQGPWSSMAVKWPQTERFEREMSEQAGLVVEGHPHLTPLRCEARLDGSNMPDSRAIGAHSFVSAEGEEIHEVAVGPVHAGIIEPGHFRFLCHGERVLNLEISLGYQHRGIERAILRNNSCLKSRLLLEVLAGDTTIGHTMAFCQALESLGYCEVPLRAQVIRAIALELERIANHVGDLGAMAGDVGYAPTVSFCGRLRGAFLNLTAMLCGNRFGRGLLLPGGVRFDIDDKTAGILEERLQVLLAEVEQAVSLLWETPSVLARFEETGVIDKDTARSLGMVGPAVRACGIESDTRSDFPYGIYRQRHLATAVWFTGDVFARAYIRWIELRRSVAFISKLLQGMPPGPIRADLSPLAPDHMVVSMVEGWRGRICHVVVTDDEGGFLRYKVVDPSFYNWMGLALAVRNESIMDFPICNKSFNLSYCGHDL